MAEKLQFREKLAGILRLCEGKDNVIKKGEVEKYFEEDTLSNEQMELVFDYLLSQKVIVKGYVKSGGNVISGNGQAERVKFSPEEEDYLRTYEAELVQMKEEPLAHLLPEVVKIAKKMYRPEIFLGDLIQEGNMGLMLALSSLEEENTSDETLLENARESMQALLESQSETKMQDKKMADRVNQLDEQIKKITEEMGRKVSVDELVQILEISEEEIEDILRLAGEELPEGE